MKWHQNRKKIRKLLKGIKAAVKSQNAEVVDSDPTVWEEFNRNMLDGNNEFKFNCTYIHELAVLLDKLKQDEDCASDVMEGLVRLAYFARYLESHAMMMEEAIKKLEASQPKTPGLILKQRIKVGEQNGKEEEKANS